MSWHPRAARTIPCRFRALTSVMRIELFLPRKRCARSRSRSPHQTVCPCRCNNCARREPVAPAPRTKIRMAWRKLYHTAGPGRRQSSDDVLKLQSGSRWRTLAPKTPTPGALRGENLWRQGRFPGDEPGMRVRLETAGPPAWKGADDEKVRFLVCACIQAYGFRRFCLGSDRWHKIMTLHDKFGRQITDLRISVTDRCNFRCVYCRSADPENYRDHDEILSW